MAKNPKPNYEQGKSCNEDRRIQEKRLGINGFFSSYDALHCTEFINELPANSIIVEIGVYQGMSTIMWNETIDKSKNFKHYGIDAFVDLNDDKGPVDGKTSKENFLKNMEKFGCDITLYHEDSVKGAERFEDNSVGFVFIDADHNDSGVTRDINAWKNKVFVGGYLCGHDRSCTDQAARRILDNDLRFQRIKPEEDHDLDDCWFYKRTE